MNQYVQLSKSKTLLIKWQTKIEVIATIEYWKIYIYNREPVIGSSVSQNIKYEHRFFYLITKDYPKSFRSSRMTKVLGNKILGIIANASKMLETIIIIKSRKQLKCVSI